MGTTKTTPAEEYKKLLGQWKRGTINPLGAVRLSIYTVLDCYFNKKGKSKEYFDIFINSQSEDFLLYSMSDEYYLNLGILTNLTPILDKLTECKQQYLNYKLELLIIEQTLKHNYEANVKTNKNEFIITFDCLVNNQIFQSTIFNIYDLLEHTIKEWNATIYYIKFICDFYNIETNINNISLINEPQINVLTELLDFINDKTTAEQNAIYTEIIKKLFKNYTLSDINTYQPTEIIKKEFGKRFLKEAPFNTVARNTILSPLDNIKLLSIHTEKGSPVNE